MQRNRRTPQTVEPDRCIIELRVIPRSSKISIEALAPDSYKVKLTSPPVEGAANEQLVKVLAERLSIPVNRIRIISGQQSRNKRVEILGVSSVDLPLLISGNNKK
jgi:uncharacterized protein (TIGR00251 family)